MNDTCGNGRPREPIFKGNYSFNTGHVHEVSTVDYIVLAAMLFIPTVIGFTKAWWDLKEPTLDDFLLGGRKMNPFIVGWSMMVSITSALSMVGIPAEIFQHSTVYMWLILAIFLANAAAAHLYMPVLYNLQVISAFEYLELRFNKCVRTVSSVLCIISLTLYTSIVLYIPSLTIHSVTGLSFWACTIPIAVCCTGFTALGGMKSVLWTDSFLGMTMVGSMLCLQAVAFVSVGTIDEVFAANKRTNRFLLADFSLDPKIRHTVWSIVIGGGSTWLSVYAVLQVHMQRALACHSLRDAKLAFIVDFIAQAFYMATGLLVGIYMSAFYEQCDPLAVSIVRSRQQLLPLFAMDLLGDYTGFPGFFLAGLMSGSMSTISSTINALAAVIIEDIIQNNRAYPMTERSALRTSQFVSLFLGLFCMAMMLPIGKFDRFIDISYTIQGVVPGPVFGLFCLGMFFPWVNNTGALCGLLGSLCLGVFLMRLTASSVAHKYLSCINNCGPMHFRNLSLPAKEEQQVGLSYMWLSPCTVISCIIIGLVVSYITACAGKEYVYVSEELLVYPLDVVFPFSLLPESFRSKFRYEQSREKHLESPGSLRDTMRKNWRPAPPGSFRHTIRQDWRLAPPGSFRHTIRQDLASSSHTTSSKTTATSDQVAKTSGAGQGNKLDATISDQAAPGVETIHLKRRATIADKVTHVAKI